MGNSLLFEKQICPYIVGLDAVDLPKPMSSSDSFSDSSFFFSSFFSAGAAAAAAAGAAWEKQLN